LRGGVSNGTCSKPFSGSGRQGPGAKAQTCGFSRWRPVNSGCVVLLGYAAAPGSWRFVARAMAGASQLATRGCSRKRTSLRAPMLGLVGSILRSRPQAPPSQPPLTCGERRGRVEIERQQARLRSDRPRAECDPARASQEPPGLADPAHRPRGPYQPLAPPEERAGGLGAAAFQKAAAPKAGRREGVAGDSPSARHGVRCARATPDQCGQPRPSEHQINDGTHDTTSLRCLSIACSHESYSLPSSRNAAPLRTGPC